MGDSSPSLEGKTLESNTSKTSNSNILNYKLSMHFVTFKNILTKVNIILELIGNITLAYINTGIIYLKIYFLHHYVDILTFKTDVSVQYMRFLTTILLWLNQDIKKTLLSISKSVLKFVKICKNILQIFLTEFFQIL